MSKTPPFKFCLYIARNTQNSSLAIANLNALCTEYLPGEYEIELVDVFAEAKRALDENIMMTPTLIKEVPLPLVRIVGTLSDRALVLHKLGLDVRT